MIQSNYIYKKLYLREVFCFQIIAQEDLEVEMVYWKSYALEILFSFFSIFLKMKGFVFYGGNISKLYNVGEGDSKDITMQSYR